MTIRVRELGPDDVETYRALRLRSLREEPDAFLASYEEESARDVELDRERLGACERNDDEAILAAFDSQRAVGLVGIRRQMRERAKGRHKAMLWGMYVAPKARGRGVGRLLVEEALRVIARAEGIELVQPGVARTNHPARALYLACGFETYGVEERSMVCQGRCIDEELMVRFLVP